MAFAVPLPAAPHGAIAHAAAPPPRAEASDASAPPRFGTEGQLCTAGTLAAFCALRPSRRHSKRSSQARGAVRLRAAVDKDKLNYYTTEGSITTFTTDEGYEFQYDSNKVLGVGAQGKVHLGRNVQTGEEVAIKVMPVKHLILDEVGAAKMRLIDDEIAVQRSVGKHPNIAQCFAGGSIYRKGTSDYPQSKVLVMEIVTGKELAEHLAANGPLDESLAQTVIVKLLAGLNHMHSQGVIHRDLKPQNILLTGDRVMPDSELKLVDFGVATKMSSEFFSTLVGTMEIMPPEMAKAKVLYLPKGGERKLHTAKFKPPYEVNPGFGFIQLTPEGYGARLNNVDPNGPAYQQGLRDDWILTKINDTNVETMLFQANPDDSSHAKVPKIVNTLMEIQGDFTLEVLELPPREYTAKVDMWAVGVVLYMCLTARAPFKAELEIIEADYDKGAIAKCSEEAKALLAGLLEKDPNKRLSLQQCLAHPWIACAPTGCTVVA